MPEAPDQRLLETLLDSWDRNNAILLNLLRILPEGGLEARVMGNSPSVAELFAHICFVRLVFVFEDAPEFARELPKEEWAAERDPSRLVQMLNESAKAVRDAVKSRVEAGRNLDLHYDHPTLLLQHMIWHEGYHHGQIKLTLKVAGRPVANQEAGPVTWGIWMRKSKQPGGRTAEDISAKTRAI
ncbi:MAG TPA: DinB family protein [Terriglobales bacterium]|nr:DinB family protein [Terriglobales bacterium]